MNPRNKHQNNQLEATNLRKEQIKGKAANLKKSFYLLYAKEPKPFF